MSAIDVLAFYTIYNPRLSLAAKSLPIPRHLVLRFAVWQFRGMVALAAKKMRADRQGGMP